MIMVDKILTKHPNGKRGVNIDLDKYNVIKNVLLEIINSQGETTYQDLNKTAITRLKDKFQGSISWYIITVKLDLEARGFIERIPNSSPHVVRIKDIE